MHYSFEPLINKESEVLILGSLPGPMSLRLGQYYANPQNQFWDILGSALNVTMPSDYKQKCDLLLSHHIALWDIVMAAERQGSLDSAIKKDVPNNLPQLLQEYPNINKILFNGTKAANLFNRHFKHHCNDLVCVRLPSTSPTPGKNVLSLQEKEIKWQQALRSDL